MTLLLGSDDFEGFKVVKRTEQSCVVWIELGSSVGPCVAQLQNRHAWHKLEVEEGRERSLSVEELWVGEVL